MNKKQIENLKKGRDFLKNEVTDEQFHMKHYNFNIDCDDGSICNIQDTAIGGHSCGSLGCAMGWMVEAPSLTKKIAREDKWMSYNQASEHLFGFSSLTNEWDFLFAVDYAYHDNTRAGAIGRINTLIKYPDLFKTENEEETYSQIPF